MPFLIAVVLGLAAIAAAVVFWYVTVPIAAILASVAVYRSSRFSPVMRGRIAGGLVILAVLTGGVGAAIHLGGTPAQSAGARSIPASPFPTVARTSGGADATSALASVGSTPSSPGIVHSKAASTPRAAAPTLSPAATITLSYQQFIASEDPRPGYTVLSHDAYDQSSCHYDTATVVATKAAASDAEAEAVLAAVYLDGSYAYSDCGTVDINLFTTMTAAQGNGPADYSATYYPHGPVDSNPSELVVYKHPPANLLIDVTSGFPNVTNTKQVCTTTSSGTCIRGGEFCPTADDGTGGTDGEGRSYICEDKTGSGRDHWETP